MDGKKAQEILKKRYDKQNNYNKVNYDRIALIVPKGTKDRIKAVAGGSVNAFISSLIYEELDRLEGRTAPQASRMPEVKAKEYGEELSIAEIKAREWAEKHQTAEPDESPQEAPKRNRVDDYINELRGYKSSEDPNSGYNNIMAVPDED